MKVKNIIYVGLLLGYILMCGACKKSQLADVAELKASEQNGINSLKKALQDEEWVMFKTYVRGSVNDSTPYAALPLVIKFDTLQNNLTITSPYGVSAPSPFVISEGVGAPRIVFGKSILTALYVTGADSTITDYYFRVLRVEKDYIEMQTYRKGYVYFSEGGPVFKMYRAATISAVTEWLSGGDRNLFNYPQFITTLQDRDYRLAYGGKVNLKILMKDASGNPIDASIRMSISKHNDVSIGPSNSLQSAGYYYNFTGFTPFYSFCASQNTSGNIGYKIDGAILGKNAIVFVRNGNVGLGASLFQLFHTNYFLISKINEKSVELFCFDEKGNKSMTGTMEIMEE